MHRPVLPLRALLAAAVVLAVLAPAAPVRAADVTFGRPTATASYGEGIDFRVEITASAVPQRVELELWFPGAIGPFLVPVDVTGTGTRTLEHAWSVAQDGHLLPNTVVRSRWVAHEAGGAVTRSEFATVTYADTRFRWETVEGDVVRVHWHQGDAAFGRRALAIAEKAIADTASLLGVEERDPVDFFIYADVTDFREALGPGTRENVGGQANAEIRTLFALIEPGQIDDTWVSIVIPHELAHLVFDTAVSNPYRYPPAWLNEGLATYLSEGYGSSDRGRVQAAVRDGSLMPLDAISGSFPRYGERIPLAYAEGASAVDFLVRRFASAALVNLVRAYKDGVTDDEAFTRAVGMDAAAFQAQWLEGLGASEPVRHGPATPPPGPLPPGWAAAGETAAPTAPPGSSGAPAVSPSVTVVPSGGTDGGSGAAGDGGTGALAAAAVVVLLVVVAGLLAARRRRAR